MRTVGIAKPGVAVLWISRRSSKTGFLQSVLLSLSKATRLQPLSRSMIFPGHPMVHNSKRFFAEHADSCAGNFQLDMVQATAQSTDVAAPTANTTSSGSKATTGSTTSTSILIIHAALAVLGFLILMPVGVIILRLMDSVRWHWVTQVIASIIAIVGGVIGFPVANAYYDAKSQASPHKGIGVVVLIATAVQVLLGGWNHWMYKRKGQGTLFGVIHRYFGWVVMVAGIANAAIGLDLVVSTTGVVAYIVIAYVFLLAVFAGVMFLKWRRVRSKGSPQIRHNVEGNYNSAIPLDNYGQSNRPYGDRR